MTDDVELPADETSEPEAEPALAPIQAVYLVRVTLRGDGEASPPTVLEAEGLVEAKFGELGWAVNAKAERVDK